MSRVLDALAVPFPRELHKTKGNFTYVGIEHYYPRLDQDAPGWEAQYQITQAFDRVIVGCSLTIDGKTKHDVGECLLLSTVYVKDAHGNYKKDSDGSSITKEVANENAATTAVAQSLKRAARHFGLGKELWDSNLSLQSNPTPRQQSNPTPRQQNFETKLASDKQVGFIHTLLEKVGATNDNKHGLLSLILGHEVSSVKELTSQGATKAIDLLKEAAFTPNAPEKEVVAQLLGKV